MECTSVVHTRCTTDVLSVNVLDFMMTVGYLSIVGNKVLVKNFRITVAHSSLCIYASAFKYVSSKGISSLIPNHTKKSTSVFVCRLLYCQLFVRYQQLNYNYLE
jgi:hypothetical protein